MVPLNRHRLTDEFWQGVPVLKVIDPDSSRLASHHDMHLSMHLMNGASRINGALPVTLKEPAQLTEHKKREVTSK
jgi:hypothetical protein